MSTGILTESERAFFRGENEVENPEAYERNARYRARQRIEQIEEDLQVLRAAGEDELAEEFYQRFSRERRLEEKIADLEARLDDE